MPSWICLGLSFPAFNRSSDHEIGESTNSDAVSDCIVSGSSPEACNSDSNTDDKNHGLSGKDDLTF